MTRVLKVLTAPVRVPAELAVAVPDVVRQLPGTVRDIRAVLESVARLTARDGELTELLREASELAARSGREKAPAAGRRERSGELGSRPSTRSRPRR